MISYEDVLEELVNKSKLARNDLEEKMNTLVTELEDRLKRQIHLATQARLMGASNGDKLVGHCAELSVVLGKLYTALGRS